MKDATGFTLLEVIIAMGILIIGIMAVMQLIPSSLLQQRMAQERTITAELANSVMGQLRASGGRALFRGNIPSSILTVYDVYGLYDSYTTNIDHMTGSAEVFLQRVTFTVALPDGREETFVTFVSQP